MKILILNYEFPPLGGGAGNATFYLLKEFAKRDDLEIDLITSSVNGIFEHQKFSRNINIYKLNIGKKKDLHFQSNKDLIIYTFRAYLLIRKLLKEKKYDLTHTFFGVPCGFLGYLFRNEMSYLVSIRGSDVPGYNSRYALLYKILTPLIRKIWRNSKAAIANSEDLKNLSLKSAPRQKIEVIYNGVNVEEFKPSNKTNQEFTVISTSRLTERKGIEYLVDGFVEFNKKHKNSKLLLIGKGNSEKELKEKIKKASMQNKIDFLGIIDHRKIADYYRKADVFVLPSLNEGMSNSLLEAMASGLAIVSTKTGGIMELIDDNNRVIIKKQSSLDIFKALEKLYLDKKKLDNFKKASRESALKMDWREIADRYLEIYKIYANA